MNSETTENSITPTNPSKWSIQRKKGVIGILFAVPSLIIVLIFSLYPMLNSFRNSFTDWDGISKSFNFVGLENYKYVVMDSNFPVIVRNTIYLAIMYVPVLNIISFIFALMVMELKKVGNFFKTLFFFPNLLSAVVVAFVWRLIYNMNTGLLNKSFSFLGLDSWTQDWLGQKNTVLLCISVTILWSAVGYYLIIYVAGLYNIPAETYEASKIDGANWGQKLVYITIPLMVPSIKINLVLSMISILSIWDLPYVLNEGGPGYASQTITMQVYRYAFQSRPGYGMALSAMFTIFVVCVLLTILHILGKKEEKI